MTGPDRQEPTYRVVDDFGVVVGRVPRASLSADLVARAWAVVDAWDLESGASMWKFGDRIDELRAVLPPREAG